MRLLLRTLSGDAGSPLRPVVAVDDAHELDDVSAALLFQLASARHAFVVLTCRTGVAVPDAVTALWRTETATRTEVPTLSRDETAALLAAALSGAGAPSGAGAAPAWSGLIDAVSARELSRMASCLALLVTGRPGDAVTLADQGYRDAVELTERSAPPPRRWSAPPRPPAASSARAQGGPPLREASALLDGWQTFRLQRLLQAELAATHALLGDLDAAWRHLARADRLAPDAAPLLDAWVERARAWVTAATGDLTRAAGQAVAAGERARVTGQPAVEALALFDAARSTTSSGSTAAPSSRPCSPRRPPPSDRPNPLHHSDHRRRWLPSDPDRYTNGWM